MTVPVVMNYDYKKQIFVICFIHRTMKLNANAAASKAPIPALGNEKRCCNEKTLRGFGFGKYQCFENCLDKLFSKKRSLIYKNNDFVCII